MVDDFVSWEGMEHTHTHHVLRFPYSNTQTPPFLSFSLSNSHMHVRTLTHIDTHINCQYKTKNVIHYRHHKKSSQPPVCHLKSRKNISTRIIELFNTVFTTTPSIGWTKCAIQKLCVNIFICIVDNDHHRDQNLVQPRPVFRFFFKM